MLPKGHRVHQGTPRPLRARLRGHVRHTRQSARPASRNLNLDALRSLREGPKPATLTNRPQIARDPHQLAVAVLLGANIRSLSGSCSVSPQRTLKFITRKLRRAWSKCTE